MIRADCRRRSLDGFPRRETGNQALRERISTLNAAILRISATLDLDTVLSEVVEGARGLSGARYGVIATVDEAGEPADSVFSGFTPEEQQEFLVWPDHGRLFQHLRELEGPLRLADPAGHVRSLGMAPARTFSRTLQGTPMRHRGADIGNFFFAEKADGEEFTDEDEEVLMLFASQATAVAANARTYRNEQRARADLEALVETLPVGVVVLDARSGRTVSINREAKRIRAALRRREDSEPFVLGEIAIDYEQRRVTVGGEAVELTATEYELLRVLSLEAGRVVTFDTLLRRIWARSENPDANLVRIFVRNLRRKLGDSAASPAYIFNQRGVGYRMANPPDR